MGKSDRSILFVMCASGRLLRCHDGITPHLLCTGGAGFDRFSGSTHGNLKKGNEMVLMLNNGKRSKEEFKLFERGVIKHLHPIVRRSVILTAKIILMVGNRY